MTREGSAWLLPRMHQPPHTASPRARLVFGVRFLRPRSRELGTSHRQCPLPVPVPMPMPAVESVTRRRRLGERTLLEAELGELVV